jgi:hypothetical protein
MTAIRTTRQEFIKKRDKQRKVGGVCGLVALVILFAPVGFMAWFEPRRDELPAHVWAVLNVVAISLMVVGLSLVCIIPLRLSKRLGLCCPECKKSVLNMSSLVIATGRCGHCGGRVLDDAA